MDLIISDVEYRCPSERVEKKWSPVVDTLVKMYKIEENSIKNFLAIYAEFYQISTDYKPPYIDCTRQCPIIKIEEPKKYTDVVEELKDHLNMIIENLLPINLRFIGALNLKDKQLEITTDDQYINSEEVSIKFNRDQIYDLGTRLGEIGIVEMFESKLTNFAINEINKKLESGTKLTIKYFVDNIRLINVKTYEPSFVLTSKYKIE